MKVTAALKLDLVENASDLVRQVPLTGSHWLRPYV